MFVIRQNATHKVVIGPCVAVGDGFTPVTTLAVSTADEAEAILHDNGTVVSISAYTFAAITTADGYYHLTLQSGISGTVGHMTVVINDDSLCLPIRADFTVMEEAAYDAMYASGAEGPLQGTTAGNKLDVTATGAAGIDWANIENKTTANDLSGTDIQLADTVTTLSGHTPQTGDNFVRLGAPAGASVSADIADVPTVAEFNARTLLAAGYFDPATDAVANVTLVDTTTTNADMRGTDSAALASVATDARLSELDAGTAGKMANQVDIIQNDTTTDIPNQISGLNDLSVSEILTTQMTEAYAADGVAPTLAQALFLIQQTIGDFAIAGTTITTKKLDGSATAATYTLDDGTNPTSRTRAT